MDALRLSELRDLLQGPAFAAWWGEYGRVETSLRDARVRRDDLQAQLGLMLARADLAEENAAETLRRAGQVQDRSSGLAAESQELENRALEMVGRFEEQRFRVSELWYRLGGAERILEERREALAAAEADASASGAADSRRRLAAASRAAKDGERRLQALHLEYEREAGRKERLWRQVERRWARSVEISLLAAEDRAETRRVQLQAERLFQEARERRARVKQLKAELAAAHRGYEGTVRMREMLLAEAADRFGCVAGEAFLYWRRRDDDLGAFAVPLADDADGHNIELDALAVYAVDRQRGVAFLEPARDGRKVPNDEGDRRFDEWLLGRRKGRAVVRSE